MKAHLIPIWGMALFLGCTPADKQAAEKEVLSEEERIVLLRKGQQAASAAFAALSTRLKQAIQAGGPSGAVSYCNLEAYPIQDSISLETGARIRRVSNRNRNPRNAPGDSEKLILQAFETQATAQQPLQPRVEPLGRDSAIFYGPIVTMDLCLKCHGVPGKTLDPGASQIISELYPEDKATGYLSGEFRGMWSIALPRKDNP